MKSLCIALGIIAILLVFQSCQTSGYNTYYNDTHPAQNKSSGSAGDSTVVILAIAIPLGLLFVITIGFYMSRSRRG